MYNIIMLLMIVIFSVINSFHDIRDMKVYDYPMWFACYTALICHLVFNRQNLWVFVLSGMVVGAFYYLIRLISRKKLGIGDVYFGFFQGLCLPLIYFPVCLVVEIVATIIIMNRKIGKVAFPFVPFMSVGLLATYCLELIISMS